MQYLTILDEEPICRFISGSHDQTILIWEWHKEENSMECVHACRGHAGSVDCVAVNDDKDKVSGYKVKYIKMRKISLNYRTSRNFDESKIKHFILKIKYQILTRRNFAIFDNYNIKHIISK